ncbi:CAAX protease [Dermabacter hominis 1368]|uniref:CAAX protease n=1 Tax=Dermabacter hominis 1368 TaxID=1450519 RepID=A0ABR4SHA1_9MICO|nr:CAAX protease [Dermabacter hominis 1368]
MSRSLKPATSIDQQIEILRSRGMQVDEDLARQWLTNVSYYRLSAYWYPARVKKGRLTRSDCFRPDVSFADVVALYEADRKLRTLVHDGMERVEVALRARLGEVLCDPDPVGYTDPARFRPSFDHARWMKAATKRIRRARKHNEAINHYRDNYAAQYPFWVLAEVLDFADISKAFEGLGSKDQREVAEGLGFVFETESLSKNQQRKVKTRSPMVSWFEQLTIVRNICAHHGRLWNRSLTPAPTAALRMQPRFSQLPEGQSERVFGALTVMAHILRIVSPGTSWPERVMELLREEFLVNRIVSTSAMGIPQILKI